VAKITTILESNGTTEIVETGPGGVTLVAGGGWRDKVAQLKAEATHVLTRHEQDGIVYWLTEWVVDAERTCPLYMNIPLDEAIQQLLTYYTGDERIIHFK
jgi:hypothetical protein